MKTNRKTLQAAMDRRLSFLDDLPSCRAAVRYRIAQEEEPVMKKKVSLGLVFAIVLVLITAAALATTLLLSPRADAVRTADRALEEKYGITADTLRYYEKVGVIPTVGRTKGGKRDYSEQDIAWVENAICMRNAGLPVEMLIEYVRLFQEGDGTFQARRDLLAEAREEILGQLNKYQATLDKLNYKISRYDEAIRTGVLTWDTDEKEEC